MRELGAPHIWLYAGCPLVATDKVSVTPKFQSIIFWHFVLQSRWCGLLDRIDFRNNPLVGRGGRAGQGGSQCFVSGPSPCKKVPLTQFALRLLQARLGSLCIIDNKPRTFDAESCNMLANMAEMVGGGGRAAWGCMLCVMGCVLRARQESCNMLANMAEMVRVGCMGVCVVY